MTRYRRKPPEIEAFAFDSEGRPPQVAGLTLRRASDRDRQRLGVEWEVLESASLAWVSAPRGSFICRDEAGRIFILTAEELAAGYEPVGGA